MTIAASAFDTAHGAGVSTLNTSSKTWVSGRLYLVTSWSVLLAGSATLPTMSGLTQQGTRLSISDSRIRITLFSFLGDGSTSTKTLDFGGTSQSFIEMIVDEVVGTVVTGTNASDAFVQVVGNDDSGVGTTAAVTLAAFANAGNATWFANGNSIAAVQTPKAGFTGLSVSNGTLYLSSEYLASPDTAPNITWSGSGATWDALGVELAVAGGDVTINPTGFGLAVDLGTPTIQGDIPIAISAFDHVGAGNVSSINTNSKTWVINNLYLVTVYNFIFPGTPALPTVSGMTQQATRISVSDSRQRINLFSFLGDGTTSAKTIDFGGVAQTYAEVVVDEVIGSVITGTNGSDAFVQTATNDGNDSGPGTFGVSLSAFAAGNNATWFAVGNGTGPATPKSGFTALSESDVNLALDSEYLASPDTAPNMTGSASYWTAVGAELASPNGGSGTVTPVGFGVTTTEGLLDVQIDTTVLPVGMALTVSRGSPAVQIIAGGVDITLSPIGFGLTASRGTATLQASSVVAPSGLSMTASVGTPAISGPVTVVMPTGLSMTASVGTPSTTSTHLIVNPLGFGLTVFLGHPSLSGKTVQLNCLQTSGDQS